MSKSITASCGARSGGRAPRVWDGRRRIGTADGNVDAWERFIPCRSSRGSVVLREAELAILRRNGASEHNILAVQANLAMTYEELGRGEQASQMERDVYRGRLKLNGEEHEMTLRAAFNYASTPCPAPGFAPSQ